MMLWLEGLGYTSTELVTDRGRPVPHCAIMPLVLHARVSISCMPVMACYSAPMNLFISEALAMWLGLALHLALSMLTCA